MPSFAYRAKDASGKASEGRMTATSTTAVAARLKSRGLTPLSIRPVDDSSGAPSVRAWLDRFRGVNYTDLNLFTRQLYTLQKAGLPIIPSLTALKRQADNRVLQEAISRIQREIEAGSKLSDALAKHPRIFNALYVNMVRSGEVSGKLVEILDRLALLGEHEEKVRRQVKSAMRYPLIVVIALVIAFLILITAVIPRFVAMYSQFEVELPLPTQMLIAVHYLVTRLWWAVLLAAAGGTALFRGWVRTPAGRYQWDGLKLRIPVFGPLALKMIMSRFSRTTGTLMQSGVPLLTILDLVRDAVDNAVVGRALDRIKRSVNEGRGMAGPMEESGLFPPIVLQMVAVGEQTGKVDELLLYVSEYYDSQVDYTVGNLIALLEPFLIFFLGLGVLFMALGIFMPMWSLMKLFR